MADSARDKEDVLINACLAVARHPGRQASSSKEANLFRVAASVTRSRFPWAGSNLSEASRRYFSAHPEQEIVPSATIVARGWISSLPRFHDLLIRKLEGLPRDCRADRLQLDTRLAHGLRDIFRQLEERLDLNRPVAVFLAGGMAVHLYSAKRVTSDVDAEFGARILVPSDLVVDVTLEDGAHQSLYIDTNFNPSVALLHEDCRCDAIPVDLGLKWLKVCVLSPVDLAVSKIARLAESDREDIADLVRLGLTNSAAIEERASQAIVGYIGSMSMLRINIREAVSIARQAESQLRPQAQHCMDEPAPRGSTPDNDRRGGKGAPKP